MALPLNIGVLIYFCASMRKHYVLRAGNFVEAQDMADNAFLFGKTA
jgi:hypothetical protein